MSNGYEEDLTARQGLCSATSRHATVWLEIEMLRVQLATIVTLGVTALGAVFERRISTASNTGCTPHPLDHKPHGGASGYTSIEANILSGCAGLAY